MPPKKAKKSKKKKAKKKNVKSKPRAHGTDGRSTKGKFVKGNQCAIGNKSHTSEHAKALKIALLLAVTKKDIEAIGKKMISEAKKGNIPAAKELFDRLWGRAIQEVDIGDNAAKTIFDILAVCGLNNGNGD